MTLTSTEKYHISTGTAPVFSPPPQTFWLLKHVNAFLNVSQGLKNQVKVKLSIVSCPPVTTVLIKRPDLKFQLGFSVQNGIVSAAVSLVTMTLNLRLNFQLRLIKCLGACRFFLSCYSITVMAAYVKNSNNELSVCTNNCCEPKAQASFCSDSFWAAAPGPR